MCVCVCVWFYVFMYDICLSHYERLEHQHTAKMSSFVSQIKMKTTNKQVRITYALNRIATKMLMFVRKLI